MCSLCKLIPHVDSVTKTTTHRDFQWSHLALMLRLSDPLKLFNNVTTYYIFKAWLGMAWHFIMMVHG